MSIDKFLNNKPGARVIDEIKANIESGSKISLTSACFSIYAFEALKNELLKSDSVRLILTGKKYEGISEQQLREYYINSSIEPNELLGTEYEIKLKNELTQTGIARQCAKWINDKVQIRLLKDKDKAPSNILYIDNPKLGEIAFNCIRDFTTDGLGVTPSKRYDYVHCSNKTETIEFLKGTFDSIWNNEEDVVDIKDKILEQMEVIYKENTPQFIYFVTLYNIFKDQLDDFEDESIFKSKTGFKNSVIWNYLYQFQKDGVMAAIEKLEKYNGCIIADSVGLGKTPSALAVIKYYELRNCKALVLCPKKLRENWLIYKLNDKRNIFINDKFSFDVLNHTDLSRSHGKSGDIDLNTINWSNYDLLVIDESHNFRNNNPRKNIVTRYQKLMQDVIKSGVKTKVLMLSATPVNNKMNDIKNQINFICSEQDDAFVNIGIKSIDNTMRKAQKAFNMWSKIDDEERTTQKFLDSLDVDFFKLLDAVTIARSRRHICKYYNEKEIGPFPNRKPPINIKSNIDNEGIFPKITNVNNTIKLLKLAIYTPITYLLEEKKEEYSIKYDMSVGAGNSIFRQKDRENQLANLMRVNMLKRLESSVFAFALTIKNIIAKIDEALDSINKNKNIHTSIKDFSILDLEDEDQELLEDLAIGNSVKILIKDMNIKEWEKDLLKDKDTLLEILSSAKEVDSTKDSKLNDLKDIIKRKINNPINNDNKKIIIFSAFADTANYLYDNIAPWLEQEFGLYSALVTGSGSNKSNFNCKNKQDLNEVLTHFSPKSKQRSTIYPNVTGQIDILIATDCISEGQNLQDCDYLVNYDIHWNPVRIIQRFGRIDRIGSSNTIIQLVNFWPNIELDEYINLESRVQNRMVMMNTAATGDDNILQIDESEEQKSELEYRKRQLKNLQESILDLEDMSGNISITDLTLNEFRSDLRNYLKDHKTQLKDAPTGIYAVVNLETELQNELKPGVIFTLKQRKAVDTKEQNVLAPYYLIHIADDGEVSYSFTQSRILLDFYKKLCNSKDIVINELVNKFNTETNDGVNMGKYSGLLKLAIESILGKKEESGARSLFSPGGTNFYKRTASASDEFELISFLVIK